MSRYLERTDLLPLWEKIKKMLSDKVSSEEGKGLSSNDFTDEYKEKLDSLSDSFGMFSFHIDDQGHLICSFDTEDPPPLSIDEKGHLIWTVDGGQTVDLGKVVGEGGGNTIEVDGVTLQFKNGVLAVNTADVVEKDNTLPITSAAVYEAVGNINALLETI